MVEAFAGSIYSLKLCFLRTANVLVVAATTSLLGVCLAFAESSCGQQSEEKCKWMAEWLGSSLRRHVACTESCVAQRKQCAPVVGQQSSLPVDADRPTLSSSLHNYPNLSLRLSMSISPVISVSPSVYFSHYFFTVNLLSLSLFCNRKVMCRLLANLIV